MEIINSTPFSFGKAAGRFHFPGHSLTLIVKGTFELRAGERLVPAAEQHFPTGDRLYPDDHGQEGSRRYESDFAVFKPRADLLLAGHCHVPEGREASSCRVAFRVGEREKSLLVFGDREWRGLPGFRRMSAPRPFSRLELRYENSFGGRGWKKNPTGKGRRRRRDGQGGVHRPLPNIEDPERLIRSPRTRPGPAGFGPLGGTWPQRARLLGTYRKRWLKGRWPWFPEDFDYGYFNAAPPDMQVEGYLRGDEPIRFENLHPENSVLESRLPGIRVRCFLDPVRPPGSEDEEPPPGENLLEVAMNLDTLWADPDAGQVVLLWRGVTPVESDEHLDIRYIYIKEEPLHAEPAGMDLVKMDFLAALEREKKEWEEEPGAGEEEREAPEESRKEAAPEAAPQPTPPDPGAARGRLKQQALAGASAMMAKLGIDLSKLPPEKREKVLSDQEALADRLTEPDSGRKMEADLDADMARLDQALEKAGIDRRNLPPLSDKARTEQARFIKEVAGEGGELVHDPALAEIWGITAALLVKAGIDPENLGPLVPQARKMVDRPGKKRERRADEEVAEEGVEDRPPEPLTRERVAAGAARGESFAGEELAGLDLSGLDLAGIDFSGATMTGVSLAEASLAGTILAQARLEKADLSGADLSGANLSGANLSEAGLQGACLQDADLAGAGLEGADLTGARLDDAIFDQAKMAAARLREVEARDAIFTGADLSQASCTEGRMAGADFSGAILEQADFRRARLAAATLEKVSARSADFTESDLFELRASEGSDFNGCSFTRARGVGSMWQQARLGGSDFTGAHMDGADFMQADLAAADLSRSRMRGARFIQADLRGARLVEMDLFEGSLERADLTGGDLSRSNLYGAEFLEAILEGTVLTGANLEMTKLRQK